MQFPKNEIRVETMRGTGPGGQRRNKVETAVRITHLPTGISAYADERTQSKSKKEAMQELRRKIQNVADEKRAKTRKEKRDFRIKNTPVIRTYSYTRQQVKDHRTGKTASLKRVLKGELDLLR